MKFENREIEAKSFLELSRPESILIIEITGKVLEMFSLRKAMFLYYHQF